MSHLKTVYSSDFWSCSWNDANQSSTFSSNATDTLNAYRNGEASKDYKRFGCLAEKEGGIDHAADPAQA